MSDAEVESSDVSELIEDLGDTYTLDELSNALYERTDLITDGDIAAFEEIDGTVQARHPGSDREAHTATTVAYLTHITSAEGTHELQEAVNQKWDEFLNGEGDAERPFLGELRDEAAGLIGVYANKGPFGHNTREEFEEARQEVSPDVEPSSPGT